jgi:hypothetical protein
MLAEALACHGWNSVARDVTGDSWLATGGGEVLRSPVAALTAILTG